MGENTKPTDWLMSVFDMAAIISSAPSRKKYDLARHVLDHVQAVAASHTSPPSRDSIIEECAKVVETKAAAQSEFQKSAYSRGDDIGGHGHWKAQCELLTAASSIRQLKAMGE